MSSCTAALASPLAQQVEPADVPVVELAAGRDVGRGRRQVRERPGLLLLRRPRVVPRVVVGVIAAVSHAHSSSSSSVGPGAAVRCPPPSMRACLPVLRPTSVPSSAASRPRRLPSRPCPVRRAWSCRRSVHCATPLPTSRALTSPPYDVMDADGVAGARGRERAQRRAAHPPTRGRRHRAGPLRAGRDDAAGLAGGGRARARTRPRRCTCTSRPPRAGHVQRGLLGALALTPARGRHRAAAREHDGRPGQRPAGALHRRRRRPRADLPAVRRRRRGQPRRSPTPTASEPLVDVELPDGLRHRLWARHRPRPCSPRSPPTSRRARR